MFVLTFFEDSQVKALIFWKNYLHLITILKLDSFLHQTTKYFRVEDVLEICIIFY